jgi:hypothetical protein
MFFVVNTNTADDILPKLIELLFKKFKARREVHPLLVCNTLKKAFQVYFIQVVVIITRITSFVLLPPIPNLPY